MSVKESFSGVTDDFFKGTRYGLSSPASKESTKEERGPASEPSIKVYIGRGKNTITEQVDWPESIKCSRCKGVADLMMVVHDPRGKVSDMSPERNFRTGKPIWPHDSMAIAIYVCQEDGEIEARWNQA